MTPNLKGIKTLVIDVDASTRRALAMRLAEWGAEVAEDAFGAHGLAQVTHARSERKPFQLIFVASAMSPMSGFEVAEVLRSHPDDFARTIVMLRSDRAPEDMIAVQKLGISNYVTKPLGRSAVIAALSQVLDGEPLKARAASDVEPKPQRILLAEDNSDVAWIIRTQIVSADRHVDIAPGGAVAVNLFRLGEYDLVLMDIQMPSFDGYWATGEIRKWERENGLKRTPIIAITAFSHEEDPQKSFRAGLDGYLAKPLEQGKLLAAIGRYLKRK